MFDEMPIRRIKKNCGHVHVEQIGIMSVLEFILLRDSHLDSWKGYALVLCNYIPSYSINVIICFITQVISL